jgi:signal transduction histidine kinase
MISAAIPENEPARQKALESYNIIDTPREDDYDEIVKLASDICGTPISLISLIDMQRQWFKANIGLDASETSREVAFCTHAILGDDVMMVADAELDERFHDNPLVTSYPSIRFYAGMPLITVDGHKLGTLCVIDRVPREINDFQKNALRVLSRQIVNHLDRRLKVNQLGEALKTVNEQNKKLEELYDVNARMLSIIGHDLRAPLSTLKSFLDMFAEEWIGLEDAKDIAAKLGMSYNYAQELIDNLIVWARNQFDGAGAVYAAVDVHTMVARCFDLLSFQAAEKKNVLTNLLEEGFQVKTETNMLYFMVRNLLHNANKFTGDGQITVAAATKANEVWINISDTGIGMTQEKIDKLFEWDAAISTYGTTGEKGSGIGLSMSQEFAHKIGGHIEVQSTVGKGSVFSIVLPLIMEGTK